MDITDSFDITEAANEGITLDDEEVGELYQAVEDIKSNHPELTEQNVITIVYLAGRRYQHSIDDAPFVIRTSRAGAESYIEFLHHLIEG